MARRVGQAVAAAAFLTFLWVPACVFDLSDVVPGPDAGAAGTSTGSSTGSGSGYGQGPFDAGSGGSAPTGTTAPTSTATTTATSTTTSSGGTDASTAPPPMPLCGACQYTHDCMAGAICLSYDPDASTGGFCGQDCTSTYCPGGYGCIAVQIGTTTYHQCAPKSGSCK